MKTPAVSSTKKASSHLPPYMTAQDRARKCPEGTFHVDDGLMFCSSCNIVIDHLQKSVVDKHLEPAIHKQRVEQKPRKQTANAKNGSTELQNLCSNWEVFNI